MQTNQVAADNQPHKHMIQRLSVDDMQHCWTSESDTVLQRLQRLTAEAGEWARVYRARQRAAAASQPPAQQQSQATFLRTVAETQSDAPVAALAAYTQSGGCYVLPHGHPS